MEKVSILGSRKHGAASHRLTRLAPRLSRYAQSNQGRTRRQGVNAPPDITCHVKVGGRGDKGPDCPSAFGGLDLVESGGQLEGIVGWIWLRYPKYS